MGPQLSLLCFVSLLGYLWLASILESAGDICCVASSKSLRVPELPFRHLSNGDNAGVHPYPTVCLFTR